MANIDELVNDAINRARAEIRNRATKGMLIGAAAGTIMSVPLASTLYNGINEQVLIKNGWKYDDVNYKYTKLEKTPYNTTVCKEFNRKSLDAGLMASGIIIILAFAYLGNWAESHIKEMMENSRFF